MKAHTKNAFVYSIIHFGILIIYCILSSLDVFRHEAALGIDTVLGCYFLLSFIIPAVIIYNCLVEKEKSAITITCLILSILYELFYIIFWANVFLQFIKIHYYS